jgi:hypothetical protein
MQANGERAAIRTVGSVSSTRVSGRPRLELMRAAGRRGNAEGEQALQPLVLQPHLS